MDTGINGWLRTGRRKWIATHWPWKVQVQSTGVQDIVPWPPNAAVYMLCQRLHLPKAFQILFKSPSLPANSSVSLTREEAILPWPGVTS